MRKYRITGCLYNETPRYYDWDTNKTFAVYDTVEKKEWDIQAHSLLEAKVWFCRNYPEYVQGGNIQRIKDTPSQDTEFIMFAIPSNEYGDGNYETVANRVRWAQREINIAIERGI